ncbi:MAG: choice-of-anchor D domain-containing protein [Melioribacteraceae bacterium]|nr:choice-of-anchor D domain-containing protein [Melioribacteraceae bacterium]MCF8265120.1 choice-of-anchor D domain-containing protein [Melioribacteraceae bacterium]MCF8413593.1 choice-of-anchor D domain-containing protein [Melioribacteraceae bacterium]
MKKLLLLLFCFLITGALNAQTYHSLTMDGVNDFDANTERFQTSSGTDVYSYVTWDADYIYVGFSGTGPWGAITDNDRVFHIYLDSDPKENPKSGNGTTDGITWKWDPTLPFNADFHYAFKTVNNEEVQYSWDGSAWQSGQALSSLNWKGSGYWEVKLSRSAIGNPEQINLIGYVEEDGVGGSIIGGFPSTLFTNTTSDGSITFADTWLNLYLYDEVTPNLAANIDNYQWILRLSAQTSSLADTNIFAGMATNATDGFDSGIDLANPPQPPSNFIDLYFDDSNFNSNLSGTEATRNIKKLVSLDSNTTMWDFIVKTDQTETVTLNASDFDFVPSNYDIKIKDVSADYLHDVRADGSYQYSSTANESKEFELIVGVTLTEANISVSPTSLSFGAVLIDSSSSSNLVLRNTGEQPLNITNIVSGNSVFTFSGSTSFTIDGGESDTISVTFLPTTETNYSTNLTITSNDADSPTLVALSGSGQPNVPEISTNADSLLYGSVYTDSDSTKTFKIYNSGTAPLTVDSIVSTNADFSVVGSTSFLVEMNDSATVTIKFAPSTGGAVRDTISVFHNDSNANPYLVTVVGTGVVKTPDISASTSSIAFGSVRISYDSTITFDIYNTGLAALSVTNITSDVSYFTVTSSSSFNVAVGDTATVSVKFTPLIVADTSGNLSVTSNDDSNSPLVIGLTGSGTTAAYSKALSSGWNLVSVPVEPNNGYRANVVGDDFSSFVLYDYLSSSGYESAESLKVGQAYWLGINSGGTLDVEGTPSLADLTTELSGGWNLVASPFNKNYSANSIYFTKAAETKNLDDAETAGWISSNFYGFDGTNYNSATDLTPWNGFWFSALQESVSMIFYYDSAGANQLNKNRPAELPKSIDNWSVNILASMGDYRDNYLRFGANLNASDNFDSRYDKPNPPVSPSGKGIETYFEYSDWNNYIRKFSSDIREKYIPGEQNKSWEFKVSTTEAGKVTLDWNSILDDIPAEIKNNFDFILSGYGISGGLDMLISGEYKFNADANTIYTFKISASVTGVESETIPEQYALDQNYPNPFNPTTMIKFALPNNSSVRLSVYNLLGEEVKVLVNQELSGGYHSVEFSANDLPSGLYFYKLTAGNFVEIKKMMLMK